MGEVLDEIYLTLLGKGWSLTHIDSMDICHYIRLMGKQTRVKSKEPSETRNPEEGVYIDELGIF